MFRFLSLFEGDHRCKQWAKLTLDNQAMVKAAVHQKTHGANWTHDTKDCCCPNDGNSGDQNKTWSHKAEEDKKKSQKELTAIVPKAVKGQVKKQLASGKKKRKRDSDDQGECFLVESLTGKPDGFNYKQMESLTLDDEVLDEISV